MRISQFFHLEQGVHYRYWNPNTAPKNCNSTGTVFGVFFFFRISARVFETMWLTWEQESDAESSPPPRDLWSHSWSAPAVPSPPCQCKNLCSVSGIFFTRIRKLGDAIQSFCWGSGSGQVTKFLNSFFSRRKLTLALKLKILNLVNPDKIAKNFYIKFFKFVLNSNKIDIFNKQIHRALKGAQAWDIQSLGFSWILHHEVSTCGWLRG